MDKMVDCNISVSVRVRGLIKREIVDDFTKHWQTKEDKFLVQIDPATGNEICQPYIFDRVYHEGCSNSDVYQGTVEPMVRSAMAGFNATIFAYGQTSSGKTHTMLGHEEDLGAIPRVVDQMFDCIEQTPDREYLIRVSYMEIYKEVVADLLAEGTSKGLRIHEDAQGQVYVADLRELCVNSPEMLLGVMRRGETARHFGVTNMNDRSSRSHTIFRIIIESRDRNEEGMEGAVAVSHLNLVDLAGSERARQTGATGERFREGCSINSSLFELGNVISKLSEGSLFINYRNSKLTRILQTSLGGNAKTAIICTVTPVAVEETHTTLRFASRAKTIKNKAHINEVLSDSAHLKRLKREINGLRVELQKEKQTNRATEVEQMQQALAEESKRNCQLQDRLRGLMEQLVVSSAPKAQRQSIKHKRRMTWCGRPRSRLSLAPFQLPPLLPSVEEQPTLADITNVLACGSEPEHDEEATSGRQEQQGEAAESISPDLPPQLNLVTCRKRRRPVSMDAMPEHASRTTAETGTQTVTPDPPQPAQPECARRKRRRAGLHLPGLSLLDQAPPPAPLDDITEETSPSATDVTGPAELVMQPHADTAQLAVLQSEVSTLRQQVASLTAERDQLALANEQNRRPTDAADLPDSARQLQEKLENERPNVVPDISETVCELERQLSAAKEQNKLLMATTNTSDTVRQLQEELAAAKQEIERFSVVPNLAETVCELEKQLSAARDEIERLTTATGVSEIVRELQEQLTEAREENERLSASADMAETMRQLQEQLTETKKENERLNSAPEMSETVRQLQEQLPASREEGELLIPSTDMTETVRQPQDQLAAAEAGNERLAEVSEVEHKLQDQLTSKLENNVMVADTGNEVASQLEYGLMAANKEISCLTASSAGLADTVKCPVCQLTVATEENRMASVGAADMSSQQHHLQAELEAAKEDSVQVLLRDVGTSMLEPVVGEHLTPTVMLSREEASDIADDVLPVGGQTIPAAPAELENLQHQHQMEVAALRAELDAARKTRDDLETRLLSVTEEVPPSTAEVVPKGAVNTASALLCTPQLDDKSREPTEEVIRPAIQPAAGAACQSGSWQPASAGPDRPHCDTSLLDMSADVTVSELSLSTLMPPPPPPGGLSLFDELRQLRRRSAARLLGRGELDSSKLDGDMELDESPLQASTVALTDTGLTSEKSMAVDTSLLVHKSLMAGENLAVESILTADKSLVKSMSLSMSMVSCRSVTFDESQMQDTSVNKSMAIDRSVSVNACEATSADHLSLASDLSLVMDRSMAAGAMDGSQLAADLAVVYDELRRLQVQLAAGDDAEHRAAELQRQLVELQLQLSEQTKRLAELEGTAAAASKSDARGESRVVHSTEGTQTACVAESEPSRMEQARVLLAQLAGVSEGGDADSSAELLTLVQSLQHSLAAAGWPALPPPHSALTAGLADTTCVFLAEDLDMTCLSASPKRSDDTRVFRVDELAACDSTLVLGGGDAADESLVQRQQEVTVRFGDDTLSAAGSGRTQTDTSLPLTVCHSRSTADLSLPAEEISVRFGDETLAGGVQADAVRSRHDGACLPTDMSHNRLAESEFQLSEWKHSSAPTVNAAAVQSQAETDSLVVALLEAQAVADDLKVALQQAQDELQKQVEAGQSQLLSITAERDRLVMDRDDLRAELSHVSIDRDDVTRKWSAATAESESAAAQLNDVQLKAVRDQLTIAAREVDNTKAQLAGVVADRDDVRSRLGDVTGQLTIAACEIGDTKAQLVGVVADRDDVRSRLGDVTSQLENVTVRRDELELLLAAASAKSLRLQSELSDTHTKMSANRHQLEQLEEMKRRLAADEHPVGDETAAQLRERLAAVRAELRFARSEAANALDVADSLRAINADCLAANEALRGEAAAADQRLAGLRDQQQQAHSQLAGMEALREEQYRSSRELDRLRRTLSEAEDSDRELKALSDRLRAAEAALAAARSAHEAAERTAADSAAGLAAAGARADSLDARLKAAEQRAARLTTELDEAHAELSAAHCAANEHTIRLERAERARDEALALLAALEERSEREMARLVAAAEQRCGGQREASREIGDLRETLVSRQAELQAQTLTLEKMRAKRCETERRVQTLSEQSEVLTAERDSLIAERDSLILSRDSLIFSRDSLTAERDTLTVKCDLLTSEKRTTTSELEMSRAAATELRSQLVDVEARLSDLATTRRFELDEWTVELQSLQEEHAQLQERHTDLQTQLEAMQQTLNAERLQATSELSQLRTVLTQKSAELESAHAQLVSLGAERDAQLAALDAERDAQLAALDAERDAQLTALDAERDAQLAALGAERDAQLEVLITEQEAQLAEREVELASLQAENDANLAALRTNGDAKVATLNAEREAEMAILRAEHEEKLESLRERHETKWAKSKEEQQAKVAALQAEYDANLTKRQGEAVALRAEHQTKMAELQTQRQTELTVLQTEREAELTKLQMEREAEAEVQTAQHNAQLQTLSAKYDEELAALRTEHNAADAVQLEEFEQLVAKVAAQCNADAEERVAQLRAGAEAKLTEQREEGEAMLAHQVAGLEAKLAQQFAESEAKLAKHRGKVEAEELQDRGEMVARIDDGESQLQQTRQQLVERDEQLQQLRQQLQACAADAREVQGRLTSLIDDSDEELRLATEELQQLRPQLAELDRQLQQLRLQLSERDDELRACKADAREEQNRLIHLIDDSDEELRQATEQLQQLQPQLSQREEQLQQLRQQLQTCAADACQDEARLIKLAAAHDEELRQVEEQLQQMMDRDMQLLRQQLAERDASISAQRAEVQQLQSEIRQLVVAHDNEAHMQTSDQAACGTSDHEDRIQRLKAQLVTAVGARREAERRLTLGDLPYRRQAERLQAEVEQRAAEVAALKQEQQRLIQQQLNETAQADRAGDMGLLSQANASAAGGSGGIVHSLMALELRGLVDKQHTQIQKLEDQLKRTRAAACKYKLRAVKAETAASSASMSTCTSISEATAAVTTSEADDRRTSEGMQSRAPPRAFVRSATETDLWPAMVRAASPPVAPLLSDKRRHSSSLLAPNEGTCLSTSASPGRIRTSSVLSEVTSNTSSASPPAKRAVPASQVQAGRLRADR